MKRSVALLVAIALLIGCAAGGTIAWLMDSTTPVTNTFTTAGVDIELTETFNTDSGDADTEPDLWQGKMVPGATITKDPTVTVKAGSEACWLFVKVEEVPATLNDGTTTKPLDDYINYTVNSTNWTELTAGTGIYYKKVDANTTTDQVFEVLDGNKVRVKDTLVKGDMDNLNGPNAKLPKLTFTAYAIQSENLVNNDTEKTPADTAAEAWALINS